MSARKHLLDEIEESLRVRVEKTGEEGVQQESEKSPLYQDAMTRLLELQGEDSLSSAELKDLCLELLFAGHSTTASAATSLLLQLNKHG